LPVNKILQQNREKIAQMFICVENTLALAKKTEISNN